VGSWVTGLIGIASWVQLRSMGMSKADTTSWRMSYCRNWTNVCKTKNDQIWSLCQIAAQRQLLFKTLKTIERFCVWYMEISARFGKHVYLKTCDQISVFSSTTIMIYPFLSKRLNDILASWLVGWETRLGKILFSKNVWRLNGNNANFLL
jgi:hypothetical protein